MIPHLTNGNKVQSGSAHPKAAMAGCFATTSLPIMVPLLSLSLTQREQLGEILGGVKVPECVAKRSLADRHAWGSSVKYRQAKSQKRIKGRSISKIGRLFCKRSNLMNTRIDYCGVIILLRNLLSSGAFSRQEIEKIARRVAAESGADLIISL